MSFSIGSEIINRLNGYVDCVSETVSRFIHSDCEDGYASEFSLSVGELVTIENEDDLVSEDDEDDNSDSFLFKLVMKEGVEFYFHSMYAN